VTGPKGLILIRRMFHVNNFRSYAVHEKIPKIRRATPIQLRNF